MLILINNQWTPEDNARVALTSDAVMYGFGLFETFRTFENRSLFRLENHLERLTTSAARIGLKIDYSAAEIQEMVQSVVNRSEWELQRLKILSLSNRLIVTSTRLIPDPSIETGVSLKSVHMERSMPEIKSTSYMDCLYSHRIAQENGCYDALLVDRDNQVTEGSRCNLFWVKDNTVLTRRDRVLPGIARQTVLDIAGEKADFGTISLDMLPQADEVFISNSIIGIAPVLRIDNAEIGNGRIGPVTQDMINRMKALRRS